MFKNAMILSTLTGLLALTSTGCDMAGTGGDQANAESQVLLSLRDARDTDHDGMVYLASLRAASVYTAHTPLLPLPEIAATSTPAPDDPTDVGLGVAAASDRHIDGDLAALKDSLTTYSECATPCGEDPNELDTDVQSCMLSCRNLAESDGITPGTPAHDLVLELDSCLDTCEDSDVSRETNRETCRLNCEAVYLTDAAELESSAVEPGC
ncbi:MAG: hypothetical protein R3A79_16160 [Nannocystaceae bacterium]